MLLVPVTAFLATFANVATLHNQGFLLKVVLLAVFAFNAILTGVYTLHDFWPTCPMGCSKTCCKARTSRAW